MLTGGEAEELSQLRKMRLVSLVEGATLVTLITVAVPLKHLAGIPVATSVMGPVHGIAFLLYAWMLVQTVSMGGWSRGETARLIIAAFIPFGAFFNERVLARRQATLSASVSGGA
jgi:integral membrane protein